LPAGQGGFLLGITRGFEALRAAGEINQLPQIIGVQSEACAPLWAALHPGDNGGQVLEEGETLAEGIRISKPLREKQVLAGVISSKGWIEVVSEGDILPGRDMLAQEGFYVEPTSAVVWPALMHSLDQLNEPIVVVLTGSGLKHVA
jgi:threonine synthase